MGKQDGSSRLVTKGRVDDSGTPILHVDMDAFFVSVELLTRPELRGKPVVVGGNAGRGVVAAASYEARRYGVNSAMPMSIALRRCPNVIVLSGDYRAYQHYSQIVMKILETQTPLVEQLSIDEAFLDVSGAERLHGTPTQIARSIRSQVRSETGLACSVGVAATKYVAKVASGMAKPDGLLVVPAIETVRFLSPLPVAALWGVGVATENRLKRMGIATVGDVATASAGALERAVGSAMAIRLRNLAVGIDRREITVTRTEKSIGHEITFEKDVSDVTELKRMLLQLSGQVAVRLRRAGLAARVVSLKLRYGDFRTVTRSHTLSEPTDVSRRIYEEAAVDVAGLVAGASRVRLIGVRAEKLVDSGESTALWDPDEAWRDTERVIDNLAARFGSNAVRPASLLDNKNIRGG